MGRRPLTRKRDFDVPAYLEMMLRHAPAANTGELDGSLAFSQVPYLKGKDVKGTFRVNPGFGKKGEKARLAEDIASHFGLRRGAIYMAASAMEAELVAIRAIAGPGDEVVCEFPTYDSLLAQIQSVGAKIVRWPRRYAEEFRLDVDRLKSLVNRRTKLIVVTNGHNPSGMRLTPAELRELKAFAEKRNVPVLLDEVYLPASAEKRPDYSCRKSSMFISIGSLDKSYRLGPLRLGWVAAHPDFIRDLGKQRLLGPTLSSVSLQMLDHFLPDLEDIRLGAWKISERGKAIVDDWVGDTPGVAWVRPTSCCIGFPKVPVRGDDLCASLLKKHKVLVPSGSYFGHAGHIRLAYVRKPKVLRKNLALISEEIEALSKTRKRR